ncbi:MAG: hypothetical protein WCG85_16025 [Polyangia bacterium]
MVSLHQIRARLATLAQKLPKATRIPRLIVILDDDPSGEEERRAAEAVGDPVLHVALFHGEAP